MNDNELKSAGRFLGLAGKTAVVTGGGVNIGRAISLRLGSLGVKTVIVYNSSSAGADEAVREIHTAGGEAAAFRADVGNEEDVKALFDTIGEQFGRIDILVNNSGIFSESKQTDLPAEEWDRLFRINVRGTFLSAREAARRMAAQTLLPGEKYRGTIINTASINALHPGFGLTVHYDTTKGAVHAFTRSLAAELGPAGIRVNEVAPGLVDSQGLREYAADLAAMVEKRNPLREAGGRTPLVRPEDVADTIVYLASSLSSAVTGETVVVDRGYLLT